MAEHYYVCLDGEWGNVMFTLPPSMPTLGKDDLFTYVAPDGTETEYKVKTVRIRVERITVGTQGGEVQAWRPPEVWYGVQ